METKQILVQSLCVPCGCHCRYCLLSWEHQTVGADFEQSRVYARGFYDYLRRNQPDIRFDFCFGYSMDHPALLETLDFLNEIGSVQGQLLQLDGLRMRTDPEIDDWMAGLAAHGVRHTNFTFYGLESYHDRFAGRKGDFSYLRRLAASAKRHGLETSAGIPLNSENASQVEELLTLLEADGIAKRTLFVPHEEGRGVNLAPIRFSLSDYEGLGARAKALLNRKTFRTEGEWVRLGDIPAEENRLLLISLTPENIEKFRAMGYPAVIRYVEELDEAYYGAIPDFRTLCAMYGDPAGTRFYGKRDLFRHYARRYIQEQHLELYDVTDERYCGSRRY